MSASRQAAEVKQIFADVKDCVPTSTELPVTVAIDAFDDHLVACAQVRTLQSAAVYYDEVSYACWNVDPKTGALEKRSDLGRRYFDCQDNCPGELEGRNGTVSWDGKRIVLGLRNSSSIVSIFERNSDGHADAPVKTVSVPVGHYVTLHHGSLLFTDEGAVLDEAGKRVARLPRGPVRVVDDKRVVHVEGIRATLLDVTTKRKQLRRLEEAYESGPVAFDGTLYAIANRKLVELNAHLKKKREISLPSCTARSD